MSTILLIEDDQVLIEMYTEKFRKEGFHFLVAKNGEEGLKTALHKHPDLILLDILMPKMNGAQVLSKLREDSWGTRVPVIVLTNVDEYNDMVMNIAENKPEYYLIKAENAPEDIVKVVKKALAERKK